MKTLAFFAIGMALGAFATSAADRLTTLDPVKVSPQYYSSRLENDRVRVLEYRLKPGAVEAMHSHPPGVVYVLANATLRSTSSEGVISETSRSAGEVFWRDATTHTAENIGTTEAHGLSIDLKPCSQ
jgi:hypothetical protein